MKTKAKRVTVGMVMNKLEELEQKITAPVQEDNSSWTIEFGKPSEKQNENVICNFQVLFKLGGEPVGNVSGFQVRKSNDSRGPWISPPSTKTKQDRWFHFGGFSPGLETKIIEKAVKLAEKGELLDHYSIKFNA